MHVEHPFTTAHAHRLLYVTEAWRDCLARLDDQLGARERFLLITGEAGMGKTSLVLAVASRWGKRAKVAVLTNPVLTRLELIEEIARRFGADPPADASKPKLLGVVEEALAEVAKRGQVPVVVLEDAHQLTDELLDELRLLANHAVQSGQPLEIALVGLPALELRLSSPELETLRQRVAVHCHLEALSHKDTRHYLHFRVGAAGGEGPRQFPRKTCSEIHELSHGVPRAINALAAESMRLARESGVGAVTTEFVRAAARRAVTTGAGTLPADVERPAHDEPADVPETPARAEHVAEVRGDPAPSEPAAANPVSAPPATPITMLPSTPLDEESRDPRVSEWVSRFVGSQGPPRIGMALGLAGSEEQDGFEAWTPDTECAPDDDVAAAMSPPTPPGEPKKPMRLIVLEDLPDDLPPSRATDRAPAPRVRHRARGGVIGPAIITGAFAVVALVTIVLLTRSQVLRRQPTVAVAGTDAAGQESVRLAPPAPAGSRASRAAARKRKAMVSPVASARSKTSSAGAAPPSIAPSANDPYSMPDPGAVVPLDPSTAPVSRMRLSLAVGSYIDAERAATERDHLAAESGLQGWIVNTSEYGGATYTVILGIFRTQDHADSAASELLRRGLVSEARVIPLPRRSARH